MKPLSILTNSALALSLLFHAAQAQEPFDKRECLSAIGRDVQNYSQKFKDALPPRGSNTYETRILDADRNTIGQQCRDMSNAEAVHINDCLYTISMVTQTQNINSDGILVKLQARLRALENGQCLQPG